MTLTRGNAALSADELTSLQRSLQLLPTVAVRDDLVGKAASVGDFLRCNRYSANSWPSPMTFEVVADEPTSDPSRIALADGLWGKQIFPDGFARPEQFGAIVNGANDNSAEILSAAQATGRVRLTNRSAAYRARNVTLPDGTTIYADDSPNYLPISYGVVVQGFANQGAPFKTAGTKGLNFIGFTIKGNLGNPCIEPGGVRVGIFRMTLTEGAYGYGSPTIYGHNTQIFWSFITNNEIGVARVFDTTMMGGALSANKTCGAFLPAGSDLNKFITRIEFNGEGGSIADNAGLGWGIYASGTKGNKFDVDTDANYAGGLKVINSTGATAVNRGRRNGRKNGGVAGEDTHTFESGNTGCTFTLTTATGVLDDGSGPTTPRYGLISGGGSAHCHFLGDLSGATVAGLLETGGGLNGLNTFQCANGGKSFTLGEVKDTGVIAPAGTFSLSCALPKVPDTKHSTYMLRVTVRDNASTAASWSALFLLTLQRGTGVGCQRSVGAVFGELGTAGYITCGLSTSPPASGTIRLEIGAVTDGTDRETFSITGSNQSGSLSHKVFVGITPL